MDKFKALAEDALEWVGQEWDEVVDRLGWGRDKPVTIDTYRGFARPDYLYLRGRVLRDQAISRAEQDRLLKNLVNNFRRFNSLEIPGARLQIEWQGHTLERTTDAEGYFHVEEHFSPALTVDEHQLWQQAKITVLSHPDATEVNQISYADVVVPQEAEFGIITDIDDTVLQTDVTSRFKLRALFHTLVKNAYSRRAFQQVSAFFRSLQLGPDGEGKNPVFYLSNSPWNLYDLLTDFLDINRLPKGPVLLRDFGLSYEDKPDSYSGHKRDQLKRILDQFPHLPFVLVGDSGEHDTDIYLEVAANYPERIKAIYIRDVQHTRRARRVEALIERVTDISVKLVDSYATAATHAVAHGLIREEDFARLNDQDGSPT